MDISELNKRFMDIKFDLSNTRYEFVEKIGFGAFGVVCKAKDKFNAEFYAIKKIRNPFKSNVALIRTIREIKILDHFQHPNIISVIEIFMQSVQGSQPCNDIYVVFNLMETDLHRIISSKQSLTDDHIRYFMYQIFCGLNYIHSAAVIHRDLKPANILVNANCLIKIADFGMSRSISNTQSQNEATQSKSNAPSLASCGVNVSSQMTQYVMTRWYRAPEVLMGQSQYDTKIDLWSCGCILAELYTGKALFCGEDMVNQLREILNKLGAPNVQFCQNFLPIVNYIIKTHSIQNPVPLAELVPGAPKKVLDLLSHLLLYESTERWSAQKCLSHIFFMKYRSLNKDTTASSELDFNFENKFANIEDLKADLNKEIARHSRPLPMSLSTQQTPDLNKPSSTSSHSESSSSTTLDVIATNQFQTTNNNQLSDTTLTANSTKYIEYNQNYTIKFHNLAAETQIREENEDFVDDGQNKTKNFKTVSDDTRKKLIFSLTQPKTKSKKKVMTAADKRRLRKERQLKLRTKQELKYVSSSSNSTLSNKSENDGPKSSSELTDLDREFLERCKQKEQNQKGKQKENEKLSVEDSTQLVMTPTLDLISNNAEDDGEFNIVSLLSGEMSALSLLQDLMNSDAANNNDTNNENNNENNYGLNESLHSLLDNSLDSIDFDLAFFESYNPCDESNNVTFDTNFKKN